jgi:hypothetical protein
MEKYVLFNNFTLCDHSSEHNYSVNRGIHLQEYDQEVFHRNEWHNNFVDALTQDLRLRKEETAKLTKPIEILLNTIYSNIDSRTKRNLKHITTHQAKDHRVMAIKEQMTAQELTINQNLLHAACFCWFLTLLTLRS